MLFALFIGFYFLVNEKDFNAFATALGIDITKDQIFYSFIQLLLYGFFSLKTYSAYKFWKRIQMLPQDNLIVLKKWNKNAFYSILTFIIFCVFATISPNNQYAWIFYGLTLINVVFEYPFLFKRYFTVESGKLKDLYNVHESAITETFFKKEDSYIKTRANRTLLIKENELVHPAWDELEEMVEKHSKSTLLKDLLEKVN